MNRKPGPGRRPVEPPCRAGREGPGADTPLPETGELRNSIGHQVISDTEAWVGSENDKAVWHELGTAHVPPRLFLSIQKSERTSRRVREKSLRPHPNDTQKQPRSRGCWSSVKRVTELGGGIWWNPILPTELRTSRTMHRGFWNDP